MVEQGEPPRGLAWCPGCGVCGHRGCPPEGGGPALSPEEAHLGPGHTGPPGAEKQRASGRPLSLLCGAPASPTCPWSSRALGDWGAAAGQSEPCVLRTLLTLPPRGASLHLVVLNATCGPRLPHPQPRQVPGAPLGSSHRPGQREPRSGAGPAPSPQPSAQSGAADSHLVAGQPALGGLEVQARLAHEDVSLAGDGPDGLRGGAAVQSPALTAGQVEQGELARGEAGQQGWAGSKTAAPAPTQGTPTHSPSRSCPARWRRPGARATSAASSRGCKGRRSAWPR